MSGAPAAHETCSEEHDFAGCADLISLRDRLCIAERTDAAIGHA
jgi:hypothetical protein